MAYRTASPPRGVRAYAPVSRVPSARLRIPSIAAMRLSDRDCAILSLASQRLDGLSAFDDAVRALRSAVEERIPAGRVYYLGGGDGAPIVGSLVTGVGISVDATGLLVVRVAASGAQTVLGKLVA